MAVETPATTERVTANPSDGGSRRWFGAPLARWESIAVVVIVLGFTLICVDGVLQGAPLGHDEAVYSAKARSLQDGSTDAGYWSDFRAPGLPFMLQAAWLGNATEPYLRMVVVAWGALGVAVTWWLGRFLFGRMAGVIAAAGLAVSPIWISASTHVWPDVPGAVLGLIALAVLVTGTANGRVSWGVATIVPLTIGATVVRYGAPGPIVVGAIVVGVWRWQAIVRDWRRVAAIVVATAVPLYVVLFTTLVFGDTEPPLVSAMQLRPDRGGSLADGWVTYWEQLPDLLTEPSVLILFVGVGLAIALRADNPQREGGRRTVLFICLATFVLLATSLSGELRYLSPLLPWLWIAAGLGFASVSIFVERRPAIVAGCIVAIGVGVAATASTEAGADLLADRFQVIREATRDHDWPADCRIATSYGPQVTWYSACLTGDFGPAEEPVPESLRPTHVFVVLGGKRQPRTLGDWLQANAQLEFTHGDPLEGNLRYVEVYVPRGAT
jgi:4-amino-4-deoxy-L-arabinose transferase-like glycosyltransferase